MHGPLPATQTPVHLPTGNNIPGVELAPTPHDLTKLALACQDFYRGKCQDFEKQFSNWLAEALNSSTALHDPAQVGLQIADQYFNSHGLEKMQLPQPAPRTELDWQSFMREHNLETMVVVTLEGGKPHMTTMVRNPHNHDELMSWTNFGPRANNAFCRMNGSCLGDLTQQLSHCAGNCEAAFGAKTGNSETQQQAEVDKQAEDKRVEENLVAQKHLRQKADDERHQQTKFEEQKRMSQKSTAEAVLNHNAQGKSQPSV